LKVLPPKEYKSLTAKAISPYSSRLSIYHSNVEKSQHRVVTPIKMNFNIHFGIFLKGTAPDMEQVPDAEKDILWREFAQTALVC
jgi:hypothetical protein